MKFLKKLFQQADHYVVFFAIIFSFLFGLAGSVVSVIRFWQYEVFYFDFGLFDKAIWSVSRFSLPIIDHIALGEKIIFADHFSPSIFLLAPLFWIFPFSETLFVAQAFIVAGSGFVLFLLGKNLLKNGWYALSIMLCYFLFAGLQNAILFDFHEVTLATLTFMLIWLSIIKKNKRYFFLSFIFLLGLKESLYLVGIGVAIAVWILYPKWRKIALISLIIALLWGIVTTKFLIPYFSGGSYIYDVDVTHNAARIIPSFFDAAEKQKTLFYTFFSFGFLPLLSPAFWVLILQDFFVRFFPEHMTTRWGLGFHYSAIIAAIMAVASVYSLRFLQTKIKALYLHLFVILLVLNALFLYRVVLDGPFGLFYNPAFYAHTKDLTFLDEFVARVPKNATVMAQNNLAPHFGHQTSWHLVSDTKRFPQEYYTTKMPDYIVIDNHPGQNPNNHYGIQDVDTLLKNLKKDKNYNVIYSENNMWLFKKNK